MKKIIVILLFVFGFIGCSQHQQNGSIDEEFLVKLGENPYNSNLYLVIPVHIDDSVHDALITISRLYHESYDANFKAHISFQEFLLLIYKREFRISALDINPKFFYPQNESVVENEYNEHGLCWMLEKYFEKVENESYRHRNVLDEYETYNILRICFRNEFFIFFDSYEGYYYVEKFQID
jgi:hypothetical protein